MADTEPQPTSVDENEEPEDTPGYKAPAQISLDELKQLDADDESLVRYKKTLLAGAEAASGDPTGPNVVVEKLSLVVEGRPDVDIDLTGDLTKLKDQAFVIKEGAEYRLKITFKVKREIVSGLKYFQITYKMKMKVDKTDYMVGSYGPKAESHTYLCPVDEAPTGMLSRGNYKCKSKFLDDDKNIILEWEWAFSIKKDWE